MKPRLIFDCNGKYTSKYSGDVDSCGDLDEFNCYMHQLEQPDLCLFRFCRDPVIYKPIDGYIQKILLTP